MHGKVSRTIRKTIENRKNAQALEEEYKQKEAKTEMTDLKKKKERNKKNLNQRQERRKENCRKSGGGGNHKLR